MLEMAAKFYLLGSLGIGAMGLLFIICQGCERSTPRRSKWIVKRSSRQHYQR
jgi:hypothetical protein